MVTGKDWVKIWKPQEPTKEVRSDYIFLFIKHLILVIRHHTEDNCLMLTAGKQDKQEGIRITSKHPYSIAYNFSSQNHKGLEGESSMELMWQMSTELDKKQHRFLLVFFLVFFFLIIKRCTLKNPVAAFLCNN